MSNFPPTSAPLLAYRSPDSIPPHWTNITLHRPDPALFWVTYRRNIALHFVLRLPRILILLGLLWCVDPFGGAPAMRRLLLTTFAIVIPLGLLLLAITRYRRERRAFADLEIAVADQGILRRGGGAPLLEITRPEIARLEARADGIGVIGRPSVRRIHIHRCLTGYNQLAVRLDSWTEIPHTTQTRTRRLGTYALWLLAATASGASRSSSSAWTKDVLAPFSSSRRTR